MKAYQLNLGKIILVQMAIAVLLNPMFSTAAWGKATVNVKVKGETVGFPKAIAIPSLRDAARTFDSVLLAMT